MQAQPDDLLDFWFDPATEPLWFEKDESFDALCAARFGDVAKAALTGGLDHWADHEGGEGLGTLALVIALDQLPRNIYRGSAKCYAGDVMALRHASAAAAAGVERHWTLARRGFLYMPFQHAEDPAVQERSVALFARLGRDSDWYKSAVQHRDIVARFGRFPHRNRILKRQTTAAERAFLEQPGSSF